MKQFWNILGRAAIVALLFLPKNVLCARAFDVRALWVVRDYMVTPEKVDEIMNFAEQNHSNIRWEE